MKISRYIEQKRDIYEKLLECLENNENNEFLSEFLHIFSILKKNNYQNSYYDELKILLRSINQITSHHRYDTIFKENVSKLFQALYSEITNNFSNIKIYNFFKENKRVLHHLFETKIIKIDESIVDLIYNNDLIKFFYFDIKPLLSKSCQHSFEREIDQKEFKKKVEIGENDSYICSLIRQDLIEDFISYIHQNNINLSSEIKPSFFETNLFLIKNNKTSLIEYAAFFGSIQIFNYLISNNAELSPSLWLYAIHGNNAEIIQILEDKNVQKNDSKCFKEAVKCHHNEIATYFLETSTQLSDDFKMKNGFRYYNFKFFSVDPKNQNSLLYAIKYDYFTIVKLLLETKMIDFNLIKDTKKITSLIFV